jgi:hypothetical protein
MSSQSYRSVFAPVGIFQASGHVVPPAMKVFLIMMRWSYANEDGVRVCKRTTQHLVAKYTALTGLAADKWKMRKWIGELVAAGLVVQKVTPSPGKPGEYWMVCDAPSHLMDAYNDVEAAEVAEQPETEQPKQAPKKGRKEVPLW